MPVQFILGRAGTGKTQHIINDLVRHSTAQPLGPPLYWLVPNQATFITQRRLMEHLPAAARIEVLGPNRLSEKILVLLDRPAPENLSAALRLLVLSESLNAVRDQLTHFRSSASRPGFINALDITLRKLVRENQSADDLHAASVKLSERGQTNLAAKLHDLALLLGMWHQSTGMAKFDPDQLPQYLLSQLSHANRPLQEVRLYIDAFSSMSRIEMDLVCGLAAHCQSVVISLLLDPRAIKPDRSTVNTDVGIFHRTNLLYQRLMHQFTQAGIAIQPPLCLSTPHRFAAAEIKNMEGRLSGASQTDTGLSHAADTATGNVTLQLLPDVLGEVVYVAREIRKLIIDGMRYRDIGIITNTIDAYDEPITRIFSSYNIPVFIDRHKPVTLHPITSAARALLRLGNADYRFADLMCLLRSGLTNCQDDDINAFENFALACALTRSPLNQPWGSDAAAIHAPTASASRPMQAAANRVRESLHLLLADWLGAAHNRSMTGAQWTQWFRSLLFSSAALDRIESEMTRSLAADDPASAQLHTAIRDQMDEIFAAMRAELTHDVMTLSEFSQLASTLLDGLMLRMIPPTIDQVLVTSSQRSRHPEFRVVFIVGFSDGQFPLVIDENLLLNPADRQNVHDVLPDLLPKRDDDVLAAPFFDYVALTRASQCIYLTRPQINSEGVRSAPSIYESELAGFITRVTPHPNQDVLMLSEITSPHDALIFAAQHAMGRSGDLGNIPMNHFISTLVAHAPESLRRQWINLRDRLQARLFDPVNARALLQQPGNAIPISVSALETYARCPLQHYFKHLIQLRPRAKWQPDALEIGSTTHEVLEQIFNDIIARRGPLAYWPQVTDADIQSVVQDKFSTSGIASIASVHSGELIPLIDLLAANVTRMLRYHAHLALILNTRPLTTEYRFAVKLRELCRTCDDDQSPAGESEGVSRASETNADAVDLIEIVGKVDRIDATEADTQRKAVIFDYKSSAPKLSVKRVGAGLELQLLSYLIALRQAPLCSDMVAVGTLYQPLKPRIFNQQPSSSMNPSGTDVSASRPRLTMIAIGLVNHGTWDVPSEEIAYWFGVRTKKDGQLYANSTLVSDTIFNKYVSAAKVSIEALVRKILQGAIEPAPVQFSENLTACGQCDYKACCPFDRIAGKYRPIANLVSLPTLEQQC